MISRASGGELSYAVLATVLEACDASVGANIPCHVVGEAAMLLAMSACDHFSLNHI